MNAFFFVPSMRQIEQLDKINSSDFIKYYKNNLINTDVNSYAIITKNNEENFDIAKSYIENIIKNINKIVINDFQDANKYNQSFDIIEKELKNKIGNNKDIFKIYIMISGGPSFYLTEFMIANKFKREGYSVEIVGLDTANSKGNSAFFFYNKKIEESLNDQINFYEDDVLNGKDTEEGYRIFKNLQEFNEAVSKDEICNAINNIKLTNEVSYQLYNNNVQIENSINTFEYLYVKNLLNISNQELNNKLEELENIYINSDDSIIGSVIRTSDLYQNENYNEAVLEAYKCLAALFGKGGKLVSKIDYSNKIYDMNYEISKAFDKSHNLYYALYYKFLKENSSTTWAYYISDDPVEREEIKSQINEYFAKINQNQTQSIPECITNSGKFFIKKALLDITKTSIKNDLDNLCNSPFFNNLSGELEKERKESNINYLKNILLNDKYSKYLKNQNEITDQLQVFYIALSNNSNTFIARLKEARNKLQHIHVNDNNWDSNKGIVEEFLNLFNFIKTNYKTNSNRTINEELLEEIKKYSNFDTKPINSRPTIISIVGASDPYAFGSATAVYHKVRELNKECDIYYVISTGYLELLKQNKFAQNLFEQKLTRAFGVEFVQDNIKYLSIADFKLYNSLNELINNSTGDLNEFNYDDMFNHFKDFFHNNKRNYLMNNSSGLPLLRISIILAMLLETESKVFNYQTGNRTYDKYKPSNKNDDNYKCKIQSTIESNNKLQDTIYYLKSMSDANFSFVNIYDLVREMIKQKEYPSSYKLSTYYDGGDKIKKLGDLILNKTHSNEYLKYDILNRLIINRLALDDSVTEEYLKELKIKRSINDIEGVITFLGKCAYKKYSNPSKSFDEVINERSIKDNDFDLVDVKNFYKTVLRITYKYGDGSIHDTPERDSCIGNNILEQPYYFYYLYKKTRCSEGNLKKLYDVFQIRNQIIHPKGLERVSISIVELKETYDIIYNLFIECDFEELRANDIKEYEKEINDVINEIKYKYNME